MCDQIQLVVKYGDQRATEAIKQYKEELERGSKRQLNSPTPDTKRRATGFTLDRMAVSVQESEIKRVRSEAWPDEFFCALGITAGWHPCLLVNQNSKNRLSVVTRDNLKACDFDLDRDIVVFFNTSGKKMYFLQRHRKNMKEFVPDNRDVSETELYNAAVEDLTELYNAAVARKATLKAAQDKIDDDEAEAARHTKRPKRTAVPEPRYEVIKRSWDELPPEAKELRIGDEFVAWDCWLGKNVRCVVAAINEDNVELDCLVNKLPFLPHDSTLPVFLNKVVPSDLAQLITGGSVSSNVTYLLETRKLEDFALVAELRNGATLPITHSQKMQGLTRKAMSEVAAAAPQCAHMLNIKR